MQNTQKESLTYADAQQDLLELFSEIDSKEIAEELQTAIKIILCKTVGGLEEKEVIALNTLFVLKNNAENIFLAYDTERKFNSIRI